MKDETLIWLENWFFQACNGIWETKKRLLIESIDNPGWALTLCLEDSKYQDKLCEKVLIDRSENDWCHSTINESKLIIAGGPLNLNEIFYNFRKCIEAPKDINFIEITLINWLQRWYYQYCDDDWEHSERFRILSTGTPGWIFSILLEGTHCEDRSFPVIEMNRSENNWYRCFLKEGKFVGRGGPFNLIEILQTFRDWAKTCQNNGNHPPLL